MEYSPASSLCAMFSLQGQVAVVTGASRVLSHLQYFMNIDAYLRAIHAGPGEVHGNETRGSWSTRCARGTLPRSGPSCCHPFLAHRIWLQLEANVAELTQRHLKVPHHYQQRPGLNGGL